MSATLTSIIAHPFEHFAEAIGKSFRALFREVPMQWQPFVFLAVVVIIIFTILALSGLQVRLPFVTIATVPSHSVALQANSQKTQKQVQTALEMLQKLIEAEGERDAREHNMQRQINTVLNTLNENAQGVEGRTETVPVFEYQGRIPLRACVGAAEERPDREQVTGTPKKAITAEDTGIEEVAMT